MCRDLVIGEEMILRSTDVYGAPVMSPVGAQRGQNKAYIHVSPGS